ncbi:DNA-binding response regulator [Reticulibacter mediterranei]|uniref:DNA-binding response regulator n=1 Tax=Reticulibacter mediterranei TaxID=2778369 RepID=A0A8J3IX06_9CHLR|nr:response regulator transcription factor [Reticulibacter mediterranei]GHP00049.1 DNA-binding response regulator [Reticulibacter mediterranei]
MTEQVVRGRTILIIEDDREMARLVRTYLEHAGYTVEHTETGEEGVACTQRIHPHLILLDLMLPLRSGWEICRVLRASTSAPIIMVTGRGTEDDRLRGFAEGADDYVTKPFSPRELVARIGAVLRRNHPVVTHIIETGSLKIDPAQRTVFVENKNVALREREFDLLLYLALHPNVVCSRADLLDHVWGYDFAGDERTIDTHVRRVREALGPAGSLLKTVWGIGYKLIGDEV